MAYFLLFLSLIFGVRFFFAYINWYNVRAQREGEYERHYHVISVDPTNAGSHAHIAEMLAEDGDNAGAIEMWRTAIRTMPHGPFTTKWKRDLKRALETQEYLDRGERPPGFNDWRVCPKCQGVVAISAKACPRCGETLSMGFFEFLSQSEVRRDWMRETLLICIVLFVAALIFSQLPMEIKGLLICSTTIVSGWLIVRALGGNT